MWDAVNGKHLAAILAIFVALTLVTPVLAELFSPINQRYISTGENGNWFYIKIHKITGDDYIGISKTDKGHIGLAVDSEYIGYMLFVPAFKHPANHKWYVCPLIDTGSYSVNLGEINMTVNGSGTYTCYEYLNPVNTGSANMTVNEFTFTANPDASIKITANITVTNAAIPEDTGFAYIFVPENQNKFRYAKVDSILEDMAGSDRSLTTDKHVEFFDAAQSYIGHRFYWQDMPNATNMMQVITLGTKKGLLMGTYGYGAGRNIYIDPLYQVDYSPEPAELLENGTLDSDPDVAFQNITNITLGVSDSSDSTQYLIGKINGQELEARDMVLLHHFNNDSAFGENDTLVFDHSGNSSNSTCIAPKCPTFTTSGKFNGAYDYDGIDDYWNISGDIIPLNSLYENISVEAWVFSENNTGQHLIYDNCEFFATRGYCLYITDSEARWTVGTGVPPTTVVATGINLNQMYHLVGTFDSVTTKIYVDGQLKNQTASVGVANMGIDESITIGRNSLTNAGHFDGIIDELAVYNRTLSDEEIWEHFLSNSRNATIVAKWSETFDSSYDWFLRLRKISSEPVNNNFLVYAYHNDTHINTSVSTSDILLGTGWFNINISSLMDYELNVASLNYTRLRFFSEYPSNISEVMLRKEVNDTVAPVFSNCQIDNTNLTNDQIARFQCNVTDDIDVDEVNGTIEGITYNFTKNEDIYYYDFTCLEFNPSIDWTEIAASDISGNHNSTDPNIIISCDYSLILNITILSPQNITYNVSAIALNVIANVSVDEWWYNLNNAGNVSFTPNTTIIAQNNSNHLIVYANNSLGNVSSAEVYFTAVLVSAGNITLSLYYAPFAGLGVQQTIYVIVKNETGDNYPFASVNITLDNTTAAMTWDSTSESYIVYWIPSSLGAHPFNVSASGSNTIEATGSIFVVEPYLVCITIWNDINMTTLYENDFAWIYAIIPEQDPRMVLSHMFEPDTNVACPPQGIDTCYFHAEYINGTACLELYEIANYTLYIIGNNIDWYQDIGSGNVTQCDFCPPVEIQQRLLLPLGNYYLDGAENIDLYMSEEELYYRGLFYGALSSWLYIGIMFILAAVAFIGTLWLTKSLKSAIAMLVILPTIIFLIMNFTL